MSALNSYSENVEIREGLREPFPAHLISKLPASSGRPSLDYVGHAAVTDRLNKVAPGWTISEPQFITVDGLWIKPDPKKKEDFEPFNDGIHHVVGVVCSMTIGDVTRWEVGDVDRASMPGDEMKKAMSDFIRRAAMRFGVALDLWSKEDLLDVALSAAPVGESTVQATTGGTVTSPRDAVGAQAADGVQAAPSGHGGMSAAASPTLSAVPATADEAAPEQVTVAYGEGASTPSGAAPTYLTKEEQKELISDYGSNKAVIAEFKKHFGDRIQRMDDITCEMVEAMNS